MANYREDFADVELQTGKICRNFMNQTIGSGDALGDRFGVHVFRDGEPVTLGGSCAGYFVRNATGETIVISGGVVSGNEAYVTLPAACYAVEGSFTLAIKVTSGDEVVTLRIVDGMVDRTNTSVIVDPGNLVPSIEDLIDAIDTAVASIPADYSSLWTSLAPAFSTSVNYTSGQYVTYNGALYRFTVDHPAGTWNSAHVAATNLGTDVNSLKSALNSGIKTKIDENAITNGYEVDLNNILLWERNSISGSTGENVLNSNGLRTISFIPAGVEFIKLLATADSNDRFILYAYDSSNSNAFVGCWYNNSWSTSQSGRLTELNLKTIKTSYPSYVYRISMYNMTSVSEADQIAFFSHDLTLATKNDLTVLNESLESDIFDVDSKTKLIDAFRTNLLDARTAKVLKLYRYDGKFANNNDRRVTYIPCKPSTRYTAIQTIKSARFEILLSELEPANGVACTERYNGYLSPNNFVTGANDRYITVTFWVNTDTHTEAEQLATVMIAEGEHTQFVSYDTPTVKMNQLSQDVQNAINRPIEAETGYGIKIKADGTFERFGGAAGKQNDYKVGDSFVNGGNNDFDSIYPWSDIRVCNIKYNDLGDPVIVYEGEAGFKRDGTNGDVVVEIPKFYTKRYFDSNGSDIVLISGVNGDGFEIERAFKDESLSKEFDKIYVGCYLTETGLNVLNSRSGAFPESNVSKNNLKQRTGDMYDFVTLQAIQKLLIVEFGTVDLSSIFGGFSNLPWSSSCRAAETKSNTNSALFKGDLRLANLNVGSTITLSSSFGAVQNRTITAITDDEIISGGHYRTVTFDGEAINVVDDTTLLYCTGQKTGFTDSIDYHTGRTNLNSGSTLSNQFKYRGIEGLWGTLGEIMDGVFIKNLRMYWTGDKSEYDDTTKYKRMNFAIPLQNTYLNSQNPLPPQIKKMGYDFRFPTIMFPEVLAAITDNYYHDLLFTVSTEGPEGQVYPVDTVFIGISSMAWDGGENNGPFTIRFWEQANGQSWLYGTRRIYRYLTA